MMTCVVWAVILIAFVVGWALMRRLSRPRALASGLATALGAAPGGAPPPNDEALLKLALTHRPDLEAAREEAVRTLAARGAQSARPALRALASADATFSTGRLRRAAKEALHRLDGEVAEARGQLSLPADDERGRLSTAPPEAGQRSSSGHSPSS